MSIPVECKACGHSFKVKQKYAGRRGGCPKCGAPVDVPNSNPQALGTEVLPATIKVRGKPHSSKTRARTTLACGQCGRQFQAEQWSEPRDSNCPSCGVELTIPAMEKPKIARRVAAIIPEPPVKPPRNDIWDELDSYPIEKTERRTTKACPFCSEDILLNAVKCKYCGEFLDEAPKKKKKRKEASRRQTDPFAVVCFATGFLGLWFLPIIFTPICYVSALVSYYRLKDNPELKGRGLRLIGAILGAMSMLYLFWQFGIL